MSNSVVTTTVNIKWFPILSSFRIPSSSVAVWWSIAPEIPAWTGVAIESIGFTSTFNIVAVFVFQSNLEPVLCLSKSWATGWIWTIIVNLWMHNRELIFWNSVWIAVFVISDRDWTTPIALTWNEPVAHLVGNLVVAETVFFEHFDNLFASFVTWKTVEFARINNFAFAVITLVVVIWTFRFFDNFNDRKFELGCKLKVALIMSRNCHDCTFAVSHQDVVRNPDWDFLLSNRIDCITTSKYASFLFVLLAFDFRFLDSVLNVFFNLSFGSLGADIRDKWMLWSKYKEGCAIDSIWASSINLDLEIFIIGDSKVNIGSFWAADPVALSNFNLIWPIELVEALKQFISIVSDLEEPLFHLLLFNFAATAPAVTVFNLLVSKHGLINWTPPLIWLFLVG